MTTVSGIVVNFRTPELACRAAESLLAEGVDEVVLVENGSGDSSADLLGSWSAERPKVNLVISDRNLGFGQGVNLGVRATRSELIVLLNSDAVVLPGCVDRLKDTLRADGSIVAVAPMIEAESGAIQQDAHGVFPSLRSLVLRTNRHPPDVTDPDWISGVAMLLRRAAFDDVGGFDARFFMYYEDVDLCRRLTKAGGRIIRDRGARVIHGHGQSRTSNEAFLHQYYAAQDAYAVAAGWGAWRRGALHLLRLPIRVLRRSNQR